MAVFSFRRAAATAAAFSLAIAIAAPAERADDAQRAREGVREGRYVSLASIFEQIESRYFGHAIEVELDSEEDGAVPTYEVEWLTPQGHVVEFEFDARTGKLLEVEGSGLEQARRP
jgi:uncharacterized membrane protein YkoI